MIVGSEPPAAQKDAGVENFASSGKGWGSNGPQ